MVRQNYENDVRRPVLHLLASVCAALVICTAGSSAQQRANYRITFRDKGSESFTPDSPSYRSTLAEFTPEALERRQRTGMDPVLTEDDRPLSSAYLTRLRNLGIDIRTESRWRNCVLVDVDTLTANLLALLPFVSSVRRIADVHYTTMAVDCNPARPGASAWQLDMLNIGPLHRAGVFGQGATIGVIDNGFRWKSHVSMQHLDVREAYDFVYNDTIVSNEAVDVFNQDGHGTLVLSLMGGYAQDSLIGVSPFSTYLLAKSEDMRGEFRVEEDLYAAAVEWLERRGAALITSSLGYRYFDSTEASTPYSAFDGRTTFASRAVNMAVARGVVCLTAAGNEGPNARTLITPADADSVLTIGGVMRDREYWPGSSYGPTADGRIKPDFMALGTGVIGAGIGFPSYVSVSGTSMATPQVAGVVALLRSLYPEARPWELRAALTASSELPGRMDSVRGHGLVDAAYAAELLGPGIAPPTVVRGTDGSQLVVVTIFNRGPVDPVLLIGDRAPLDPIQRSHPVYVFSIDPATIPSPAVEGLITVKGRSRPVTIPKEVNDIVCGSDVPNVVTSIPSSSRATLKTRIAPSILSVGQRDVRVLDAGMTPRTAFVIDALGRRQEVGIDAGLDIVLHIPHLAPGSYRIIMTGTTVVSLPLIIR